MVGITPHGKWNIFSRTNLEILLLQSMLEEGLHWPQSFLKYKQIDHEKVRIVVYVSRRAVCACILVILQLQIRKTTLRGSSFTVVRGWHRSECDCLALSPKVGAARTRIYVYIYIQVFSSWGSVVCSVCVWGVFRGEECIELILQLVCQVRIIVSTKTIAVNGSFIPTI